jgi:hypothetical protein
MNYRHDTSIGFPVFDEAEVAALRLTAFLFYELKDLTPDHPQFNESIRHFESIWRDFTARFRAVSHRPSQPGYEEYLIDRRFTLPLARFYVRVVMRRALRVEKEGPLTRDVVDATRFFANPGRGRSAAKKRAKLILAAGVDTSIVDQIFGSREFEEREFTSLLRQLLVGDLMSTERISEIVGSLSKKLTLSRGRKPSAPTIAHGTILKYRNLFPRRNGPRKKGSEHKDYYDPLAEATKLQFQLEHFDGKPAQRRLRRLTRAQQRPTLRA